MWLIMWLMCVCDFGRLKSSLNEDLLSVVFRLDT